LLPRISGAVVDFRFARLAWGGLGIIVRAMIAFYLFQEPVAKDFRREPSSG
jgi:hypothetical protein